MRIKGQRAVCCTVECMNVQDKLRRQKVNKTVMSLTRAEKEMISQHGSDFRQTRICETHPSIRFRKRKREGGEGERACEGTRRRE